MQQKSSLDKNTLLGLLLMGAILIGFGWFQSGDAPASQPETIAETVQNDSLQQLNAVETPVTETVNADMSSFDGDSALLANWTTTLGVFAPSANLQLNDAKIIEVENDILRLKFSSKGAKPVSVEMKEYHTYDSLPLMMLSDEQSYFNLNFWSQGKQYQTANLIFDPVVETVANGTLVSMRLYAGDNQYVAFEYLVPKEGSKVEFNIRQVGLNTVLTNNSQWDLNWNINGLSQEQSFKNQREKTTIYYKNEEGVDYISELSDDEEELTKVDWVAYKNQFFATIVDPKDDLAKAKIQTITPEETNTDYVKSMNIDYSWNFMGEANKGFDLLFVPNHFQTLNAFDKGYEELVPLGWGIFGWINRWAVIPLFNLLDGFNWNYGLIIFIMALLIKMVLFPLTYKSYTSMAKMRVLKPEIDKINEQHEDQMKRQQATMELYRKAGANPLGGCLPMLLQFPILIALFRFFPASFELRQESFLWATDLSTYDSIYNLPFTIPFYGDHVSLFTLLMTISTLLYTWMNNQINPQSGQMAQMKWMMYLMPVVFLGVLNNYPAALSYYYFLANMITFGQQYAIRSMTDDQAILAKIEANKKGPAKKSKFQARMEEMAKQRQMQQGKK